MAEQPNAAAMATDAKSLVARLEGVAAYDATVVSTRRRTPNLHEVVLHCEGFTSLVALAGQDVMVEVPGAGTERFRRRYSIVDLDQDAATLALWIVAHGAGAGEAWVQAVAPGAHVDLVGPRGKQPVSATAAHHLYFADHSALGATKEMVAASRGESVMAFVEVATPEDAIELHAPSGVPFQCTWGHHDGHPGETSFLADAARTVALPPGVHVYINCEFTTMHATKAVLLERGLDPAQVVFKPYWRKGLSNAAHGEPPKG